MGRGRTGVRGLRARLCRAARRLSARVGRWQSAGAACGAAGAAGARRTAAAVDEREGLGVLVGDELHLELGRVALAQGARVGERHEAHLVERLQKREARGEWAGWRARERARDGFEAASRGRGARATTSGTEHSSGWKRAAAAAGTAASRRRRRAVGHGTRVALSALAAKLAEVACEERGRGGGGARRIHSRSAHAERSPSSSTGC